MFLIPADKIAQKRSFCFSSYSPCPANYTCMPNTGPNPISKYISYDNFGWALLTSLQLVTMDYWESIYNSVSIVSEFDVFHSFVSPSKCLRLVRSLLLHSILTREEKRNSRRKFSSHEIKDVT